jgi:tripartite-type tricarboxylate transporter receptor subunit TctC
MLGRAIGMELVQVPYKGGAPLAERRHRRPDPGRDRCAVGSHPAASRRQGARARELGREALANRAGIPTFTELGYPQIQGDGWFAFHAPAKTPKARVDRLSSAFGAACAHRTLPSDC